MAKASKPTTQSKPPTKPLEGKPAADKPLFAFPNRSRCPRCKSPQTECYGEIDGVQYRRCLMGTCRWRYKITGQPI